jgi:hypothetical protein
MDRFQTQGSGGITVNRVEDKQQARKRLASLSFSDKLKLLEKLRIRSRAIAASGLRSKPESGRKK